MASQLGREIENIIIDMDKLSRGMRLLNTGEAVGTSRAAAKFRKLQDGTRNDAIEYLKVVLPYCGKFVASVSKWFENYKKLDYEEWCDNLEYILEETTGCKQLCETITTMHKDMLIPLKKRQDQAHLVVRELEDLQLEFERKKRELEKSASVKTDWAIGLLFVPIVNLIATPILLKESEADIREAVAHGAQAQSQKDAALMIQETLIPALQSFISGLHKAAGFFQVMEMELGKFQGKAEKGKEIKKKLHYKMMKAEARKIDAACQRVRIKLLEF